MPVIDISPIVIRNELEQKRRGFALLAELSISLRQSTDSESIFFPAARRINAMLNMQRTVVMVSDGKGLFTADVLQGYPVKEKAQFAGKHISIPCELLDPDRAVLVTGADPTEKFRELRKFLDMPYFISSPVILQGEVCAILFTGRLVEAPPSLVRLSCSDMETVQAICALLASVIAGQRLAAAEERTRILLDTVPMCCAFWDEKGDPMDCNRETLSMFKLSDKKEFIEKFYDLSPEYQSDGRRSREAVREIARKSFVSGGARFEWTHMTVNGELIPTDITIIRVPKGEDYVLAGFIRDLREQNEAKEAAMRYTKAKSEFLASISHEIRTPLNAISAMARIAGESRGLSESQQKLINQGMRSVKLLTSAIETILDFSKLDSGQMLLETGEFSVHKLMEDISSIVSGDIEKKSLYFRLSVDPGVPGSVLGDSVRLQHSLLNIIMNAIKFTEAGGVEFRVKSEKTAQGDAVVLTFEIQDTGIGISEEQQKELFKPLYSADASYTRKYGGLGMGLTVSSGLVMVMGGEITCESRLGSGSTFRLIIPLALPGKPAEAENVKEITDMTALTGLQVLVAEDNDINQMIIEELLSSAGITVTMANNGIEALEILQQNMLKQKSFDVVLMDIQMPEMDGLTATGQIRADHRFDKLPVLAMTANAGAEHIAESINAGMNDHLTKPIDPDQLYNALRKWRKR